MFHAELVDLWEPQTPAGESCTIDERKELGLMSPTYSIGGRGAS